MGMFRNAKKCTDHMKENKYKFIACMGSHICQKFRIFVSFSVIVIKFFSTVDYLHFK